MSKTEYVYVKGMIKWCRNKTPNEWGKYAHVMYLDPPSLEIIRDLQAQGLKNVIKKDEEGYFTSFSRPTQKVYKGKVSGLEPPLLLDGSKTLPDGTHPPLDALVGNGSIGTTKLEVYQHGTPGGGKAKAARWLSTLIHDLVPYQSKSDFADSEQAAVEGMAGQKEPLF